MSVNKYKIVKSAIGKQIDLPIEMKWDFSERDQAIDTYQGEVLDELIGLPNDFAHFATGIIENSYINGVVLRIDGG